MRFVALAFVVTAACAHRGVTHPSLTTTGEASGYRTTGRYSEVSDLCDAFAQTYAIAHCATLGVTREGRSIVGLRIEKTPGLPFVYFEGGIHAGEIEGKDAGFWFLRDLLDGKVVPGALDHVSILFVPVINPDGHERWSKNNRPNQRGPEEMGFRTTGERLNLNRDWVKSDSPEVQAVLAMFATYDPLVFADLHTTDGAKFETDLSVTMSPQTPRLDGLDVATTALSNAMMTRLTELGHHPVDFYPSFNDDTNPNSGFSRGEAPPRFGAAYMPTRNRIGVLVETHSWRTYKERVLSTYHSLQALTEYMAANAARLRGVMHAADAAGAALGGTDVTLTWKTDPELSHDISFRGYAYERTLSELTGGVWVKYDETKPERWIVPLFDHVVPNVTITAPTGGYYVDGGFAQKVADVLDRHGIRYVRVDQRATAPRNVEAFRATATNVTPNSSTYRLPLDGATFEEGHTKIPFTGEWKAETRALTTNAIFVPIAQPKARLVMHLLEPTLPDSLAVQGMFNSAFQQVEYAEDYVLEVQAREMFAADPELAAEFAEYAATSVTPSQKLMWIYRHTPAWDERYGLLPVYRTTDVIAR